jgi:hypothetical protein
MSVERLLLAAGLGAMSDLSPLFAQMQTLTMRVAMARWLSLRHADGTLYITNRPERERDVLAKVRSLRSTGKPSDTLDWQR